MPHTPPPPPPPPFAAHMRRPGQMVLLYAPDGPLGGTFTCTGCWALAWQPDLLQHAASCPYWPGPGPTPASG